MWFLLLQIFLLLLLAAVLGALLAYWWMRNRYEDVTESHDQMLDQVGRLGAPNDYLTRKDLDDGMASFSSRMPVMDLDPLNARMVGLESSIAGISIPEPDLDPLHERISALEAHLLSPNQEIEALRARLEDVDDNISAVSNAVSGLQNADMRPVEQQMETVTSKLSALSNVVADYRGPDLRPFEARMATLEQSVNALSLPEIDLAPLHSGMAQLELSIAGIDVPEVDFDPTHKRLARVETQLAGLGEHLDGALKSEFEAISSRLSTLSSTVSARRMPDMTPVHEKLSDLERAMSGIEVPEADLSPLHNRMNALESSLGMILQEVQSSQGLKPIETRLAGLQEAFLSIPSTDLSPVLDSVRSIDSRMDFGAVENRLTAIEYGLAAIHHMLRSRTESTFSRPEFSSEPPQTVRMEMPAPAPQATNQRPPRNSDPINPARRVDDKANLLVEAAFGSADDLEQISGVGPMLCNLLHDVGVFYFWQMAEWSPEEVQWVDTQLMHFKGRIERDDWVGQAKTLAALTDTAERPMALIKP
ncbi:MAG: hypothetical protein V3V03_04590 [Hyphomonadaceae bacterium]